MRIASLALFSLCCSHSTAAPTNETTIDLTSAEGYADLRACAQKCVGFVPNNQAVQCGTNFCLCTPSHLYDALNFVYTCTHKRCDNLDDAEDARSLVQQYCANRGYTQTKSHDYSQATESSQAPSETTSTSQKDSSTATPSVGVNGQVCTLHPFEGSRQTGLWLLGAMSIALLGSTIVFSREAHRIARVHGSSGNMPYPQPWIARSWIKLHILLGDIAL
ncbi:hypothetical protein BKA62DRAFT_674869 [Auriculariales sp. MPI-PUGE-AT-0066]|nr:hypothetical protein BKA62DRAFT_674869 [Auriculariales sp. MPI-PUGE-AT-0066]